VLERAPTRREYGADRGGGGRVHYRVRLSRAGPGPVTTIAWRLAHIIAGCFAARNGSHFDGPDVGDAGYQCWRSFTYAGTAKQALEQFDEQYSRWIAGVRALGTDGLGRPCGPAEDPYGDEPMATLVLHINREVIRHGAEITLLRDLYRHYAH
jgi:hypothetical protein